MSVKSGSRELIWISASILGVIVFFFTVLYLRGERDPVAQIALKAKRVELVKAMRLSLAAASEAQNSAVLSTGEDDAKTFADQARAASAALNRAMTEFETLLKQHAVPHEVELMDRVVQTLRAFQQVDNQLLDLASQNSNRKAFGLAFGPGMTLLQEMDSTLSRIVANHADSPSESNMQVLQLASNVRISVLRIQVLLHPHIAEPSEQRMDEFEAKMSQEDRKIRENFATLNGLSLKKDSANIEKAMSHYAEFEKLRSQIIKLSRDNTNVRAVAIALNEKRQAMLACQDALVALDDAIQAAPVTSAIPSGRSP